VSIGKPIGLVGVGPIERVDIDGPAVALTALPTFPDCLFRDVFEGEIEGRLQELLWCRSVTVAFALADEAWDESQGDA
jgi:metal-sulfur cluster biosynthetic enzyme